MSSNAVINYQNPSGTANVTLANNAVAYLTPGSQLTVNLNSNTGVIQWQPTIQSDYPPLNGLTFNIAGPLFTFTVPLPQQTCTITLTSETSDGQNINVATNKFFNFPQQTSIDRSARFVATSNLNIANCNVNVDGTTANAGDRLLLVGQTNLAQNGPYVVGTVTANNAALTRPPDYLTGQVLVTPPVFEITEGTQWQNSEWKYLGTLNYAVPSTIDTNNMAFYPRLQQGTVINVAATANANVTSVFIFANVAVATTTGKTSASVPSIMLTQTNGAATNAQVVSANVGATPGAGTMNLTGATGNVNWVVLSW